MAAKGAESKTIITEKILTTFEGSFMADSKTIRIPMVENGDTIEIKVTLTAAKDVLGGAFAEAQVSGGTDVVPPPTEEEKQTVEEFVKGLGF